MAIVSDPFLPPICTHLMRNFLYIFCKYTVSKNILSENMLNLTIKARSIKVGFWIRKDSGIIKDMAVEPSSSCYT